MNIETALIEVADAPLRKSPYSGRIIAIVNAYSRRDTDKQITRDTTGQEVLTILYHFPDESVKERILTTDIGVVRSRDSYKTVLLVLSGALAIIGIILTVAELGTEDGVTNIALITTIVENLFGLAEEVVAPD